MKLFGKDTQQDIVLIAEIGVNHEGSPEAAMRLLRLAAKAGADAVKFQHYTPERYASASDPNRLNRVRSFRLDAATFEQLAAEAERLDVGFFSSALSEDVVPFLDTICDAHKIASGDLTFRPVIQAAAATGNPLLLSTGLATVEEIDQAVAWVRQAIGDAPLAARLVLLHCVSAYPAELADANIRSVPFLAERYGVTVGYSNHVVEPEPCLAAAALGATVFEVHFTDQKQGREFRDHSLSFEPGEFAALAESLGRIRRSLGTFGKAPAKGEVAGRTAFRKGVIAARDLPAGTALSRDDLMFARPATEFVSGEVDRLPGRQLKRPVRAGELIARDNIE